jgi:hypothetical protein
MDIEVIPIGNTYRREGQESDIVELFDTFSGLRVTVSTWIDSINETYLQIYWRFVNGYRNLDEFDLIAYWKTQKFSSGHHVYEITAGGWLRGEPVLPDMLDSARNNSFLREWFICTTNGSMNVLAVSPPVLMELKRWPTSAVPQNDAEQIVGPERR